MSATAVASAPEMSTLQRQAEAGAAIASSSVADAQYAPTPPLRPSGADFTMPTGAEITAFGDSLVVTTAHGLTDHFPGIMLDAKSNRQCPAGAQAVHARLFEGTVRRAVILDFGTNAGVPDPQLVHDVINALGTRMIVLVNLYGSWEESNPSLAAIAAAYPNVVLADWYSAISARPTLLQSDGVHPGIQGGLLYADVIRDALRRLSTR